MTKHGISTSGTVGGFCFAPSRTGNADLDRALDRIGEALTNRTPEEERAAKARAEAAEKAAAAYAQELKQEAAAKIPGDRRFLDVFNRAVRDGKGMSPSEAARLASKRTAHFFVANVDGRTIDRLAKLYRRDGSAAVRAVGAELAREVIANPGKFQNPISVLDWRLRKHKESVA